MKTQEFDEILEIGGVAADIADQFHAKQKDRAGQPYFNHCFRVATTVFRTGGLPKQVQAAFLHDVIEDTPLSYKDLFLAGIRTDVLTLVLALTHAPNEPYADYISRIMSVPGASDIKIADLYDNLAPERLLTLDLDTRNRLMVKYGKALVQIGAA